MIDGKGAQLQVVLTQNVLLVSDLKIIVLHCNFKFFDNFVRFLFIVFTFEPILMDF